MKNDFLDSANLLTLGLTFPTIMLAAAVVYTWYPAMIASYKKINKTAEDWFILGVCLGFIGAIVHGTYWFYYWSLEYFQMSSDPLVTLGPIVNICTRQGLGIAAAYCHIKASGLSTDRGTQTVNNLLVTCNFIGVAIMLFLFLIRVSM